MCVFMCVGSEESRVALLSKLSESLSKELGRQDRCPHLFCVHSHLVCAHCIQAAADARAEMWWKNRMPNTYCNLGT